MSAPAPTWLLVLISRERHARSEITIDLAAGNWYANVLPNDRYDIVLGVRDASGELRPFLTCEGLLTPPVSHSHLYDPQWKILEKDYLRLLSLGWTGEPGGSSATSGFLPSEGKDVDCGDEDLPSRSCAPTYTDRH